MQFTTIGRKQKDNNLNHGDLVVAIEIPENNFADKSYYIKVRDGSIMHLRGDGRKF